MTKLTGKVAIVTGASKGIGAAIAQLMAAAGAQVVVNFASSKTAAEQVVAGIVKAGGKAVAFQADVCKVADVKALFTFAKDTYGKIDVLVNNAGIMRNKPIKDFEDDEFTAHFEINVRGVFNALREAATQLADQGKVINISSSTTRMRLPAYGIYSATKAAVEQMSKVFSKEVGRGISVNVVSPGPTRTELFLQGKSQEFIDQLIALNNFGRLGEPEDIARVVTFLASDESTWISGQVVPVNGGAV